MRTVISLTNRRDPDLLSLYYLLGKQNFLLFLKDALRSLVRRDYIPRIQMPKGPLFGNDNYEDVKVHLSLTAEKDKDVEKLLLNIKKRRLGAFMKQTLRIYIGTISLQAYFSNELEEAIKAYSSPAPTQVYNFGGAPVYRTKIVYRNNPTSLEKNGNIVSIAAKAKSQEQDTSADNLFCKKNTLCSSNSQKDETPFSVNTVEVYKEPEIVPSSTDDDDMFDMLSALLQ